MKELLVHGWENGRPVVKPKGQIKEAEYDFSYRSSTNGRTNLVEDDKSYLRTGRVENTLCGLPLNNGYSVSRFK